MNQPKISLKDRDIYELIDSLVKCYIDNLHTDKLFQFFTKKALAKSVSDNVTLFFDTSRKYSQLIAFRFSSVYTVCFDKTELLFNLGFRSYESLWLYPDNDSKLMAFVINFNMFNFKSKDNL